MRLWILFYKCILVVRVSAQHLCGERETLTGRRVCWAWVWLVREVWVSVPCSC